MPAPAQHAIRGDTSFFSSSSLVSFASASGRPSLPEPLLVLFGTSGASRYRPGSFGTSGASGGTHTSPSHHPGGQAYAFRPLLGAVPGRVGSWETRWRAGLAAGHDREMSPLPLAAGLVAIASGVVLAALPFDIKIDLANGGGQAGADCRPPVLAAWNRQPKGQLALWAVTDLNDGSTSHVVRCGAGPYCAGQARLRLRVAAGLMAGGLTAVLLGRRGAP